MKTRDSDKGLKRQIKLLYDNADFVERIFENRELFVASSETEMMSRIERLKRARIVRTEVQRGGRIVRLTTATQAFCRLNSQRARLERLSINIDEVFSSVDASLERWYDYDAAGRDNEAAEYRDLAEEALEDAEHWFAEKIERVQYEIKVEYGFDERAETHIKRFRSYVARIHELHDAARDFTGRLGGEEYRKVWFLYRMSNRMNVRFQRHAVSMTNLIGELNQYISQLRQRQELTRRSVIFLRWLQRQPQPLHFPLAEAAADELAPAYRFPAIPIAGFPDLNDPVVREQTAEIARDVVKRFKASRSLGRRVSRPASGARRDTAADMASAKRKQLAARAKRWNSKAWADDYIKQVARLALDGHAEGLSAMTYWRRRVASDSSDKQIGLDLPTARGWLNEIVNMALNNRVISDQDFFERFTMDLVRANDQDGAQGLHTPRVSDVVVQMRTAALQALRARATA